MKPRPTVRRGCPLGSGPGSLTKARRTGLASLCASENAARVLLADAHRAGQPAIARQTLAVLARCGRLRATLAG